MATLWQTVVTYLQKPMKPDPHTLALRAGGPLTATEIMAMLNRGSITESGMSVTETTALNVSAVWCAVKNIAGTVGTLPLILYKRFDNGGRDRYLEHPLYRILHDRPHPEVNAATFWTTLESHVLLWGNGYAEIQRDRANRVVALALITPERVTVKRETPDGRLYYEVSNPSRPVTRLESAEMLHVKGLSHDGTTGYSVIGRARQGLGLTLATEKWGSSVFSRGPQWSGILTHPKTMRPETKRALRDEMRGLAAGDWPMLEEGIEWKQTGMPADDMQYLQTRQFQVVEVARWFNIPPHKLKDLERATFSNIEEQGLDYLTDCIRPELVNIAQEVNTKLIAPSEQRLQYVEHLVDALLQGRKSDRNASYAVARQWGWLCVNEIRAFENLNPIPDGDQYLVPTNMAPADKIDDLVDAQTRPDPAPQPTPRLDDDRKAIDTGEVIRVFLDELKATVLGAFPPAEPAPPPDHGEMIRGVVSEIRDAVVQAIPAPEPLPDLGAFADGLREEIIRALPPPPAPPEPVEEPEPAPDNGPEQAARRHAGIVTGHRLVVEDAVRRCFNREKDRMRPAATSPERLRGWVGEFYDRFAEAFLGALAGGIQSHCAYVGGDLDPEAVGRALVAAWCEESKRQIHALLDRHPADLRAEVEAMLTRWEVERLHGIPDAVMQEEMVSHG